MTVGSEDVAQPASRFGVARLYRDAGSMAVSSVVSAVLGIVFWGVAAKMFEPAELGVMTAILAVIIAAGVVLASGVGDAYTALLPAAGADRAPLYRRGQRIFFGLATLVGFGAAIATTTWLPAAKGSMSVGVLVFVGILAWSALNLQNSTLVALGRARWLPASNLAVSIGKIVLLVPLAASAAWHPVETAFVAAAAATVAVVQPMIHRVVDTADGLPQTSISGAVTKRTFDKFIAQTTASSALSIGLMSVTPFLVTVFAGPSQGALFSLSLSIVQVLDFISAALVVSLVVHGSSSPEDAGAMAKAILMRSVGLALVGGLALVVVAPPALRLLNESYDSMGATQVIALLAAGTVFRCTYMVWAGLERSRRNMKLQIMLNLSCAIVLLSVMPEMCDRYGATGGAVAMLIAQIPLTGGMCIHGLYSSRKRRRTTSDTVFKGEALR